MTGARRGIWLMTLGLWGWASWCVMAADKPDLVSQFPAQADLPDPLTFLDGSPVKTPAEWREKRRPELKRLFEQYVYGVAPAAPAEIQATIEREDKQLFKGLGTKREVRIQFGAAGTPPINLLLILPNKREKPAPVFVAANFCGNHTVLDDPTIPLPQSWMYGHCQGCMNNKATDAGRGKQSGVWAPEYLVSRGYALATFYNGDIDPDQPGFEDGIHPHFRKPGQTAHGDQDWGTIAAWAWGIQRIVDYLITVPDIDAKRICVTGHSRLGKTALLAGAFDDRIALVVPHQSGTGGCAMSRQNDQETVERITRVFPHWFCGAFRQFGGKEEHLPVDQHLLIALVAPRPFLDTEGLQDTWANYDSAYKGQVAVDKVYKFLGSPGRIGTGQLNGPTQITEENAGTLLQYRLDSKHELNQQYWQVMLDFADVQFARK